MYHILFIHSSWNLGCFHFLAVVCSVSMISHCTQFSFKHPISAFGVQTIVYLLTQVVISLLTYKGTVKQHPTAAMPLY